ncbi:MAG: DUF4190 domain-containing protein, partial [Acidimicrobiia bacterium]
HCAEELPDEATVCPQCHNDPAVIPDWARPERDGSFWRSQGAGEPDGVPRILRQSLEEAGRERPRGVAAFLKQRLEPSPSQGERPIPTIVWVSLALSFSGLVTSVLPFGLIIMIVALVTGLILGVFARRQIKASNGTLGGLVWANIAIGLNLIRLIQLITYALSPLLLWSSRG